MEELARGVWEKRQLPPSWLDERTPHEILFLFGRRPAGEDGDIDRMAELHRLNHGRAVRGEGPIVPKWLTPDASRSKRGVR